MNYLWECAKKEQHQGLNETKSEDLFRKHPNVFCHQHQISSMQAESDHN